MGLRPGCVRFIGSRSLPAASVSFLPSPSLSLPRASFPLLSPRPPPPPPPHRLRSLSADQPPPITLPALPPTPPCSSGAARPLRFPPPRRRPAHDDLIPSPLRGHSRWVSLRVSTARSPAPCEVPALRRLRRGPVRGGPWIEDRGVGSAARM